MQPNVAEIRRALQGDKDFAVQTLLALVRTSSVAPEERKAQELFAAAAAASGLEVAIHPIDEDRLRAHKAYVETGFPYGNRPNVTAHSPGRGGGPPIIFNSHIDTVLPAEGWTRRVDGEVRGTRVYGLGSADAKGCLITALMAARVLRRLEVPLRGDLIIQSVIDEEPSGNGTLGLLLSEHVRKSRLVVVLEPTDLQVAYGHRGMFAASLVFRGRSGHGATGRGVNAVVLAAQAVLALDALNQRLARLGKDPYAAPRLNVGSIEGGKEVYTTPDHCVVNFSIRYAPGQRNDVLALVRDTIANLQKNPEMRRPPRLIQLGYYDAAETERAHAAVQTFLQIARAVRPRTTLTTLSGTCDARHFVHAKMRAVIFGPGKLEHAHAPDEHVEIGDILDGAAILAAFAAGS